MPLDQQHAVEEFEKQRGEMSFFDHITELRWHLIRIVIALFVVTIIMFLNKEFLFKTLLLGPMQPDFPTFRILCNLSHTLGMGQTLCITPTVFELQTRTLGEAFLMHMLLSFWTAVVLTIPYLLWEIWRFIGPGLYETEQKAVRGGVFICSLLFAIGVAFGYYVIAPFSISFLAGYDVGVKAEPTLESYVDYMVMFTIPMGMIFELPVLSFFLAKMGILTAEFMRIYRRYAVVLVFVISAIITPSADMLTQCLVAFPLYFLYEVSIGVVGRVEKKRNQLAENQ